jgi:hypothetical protein
VYYKFTFTVLFVVSLYFEIASNKSERNYIIFVTILCYFITNFYQKCIGLRSWSYVGQQCYSTVVFVFGQNQVNEVTNIAMPNTALCAHSLKHIRVCVLVFMLASRYAQNCRSLTYSSIETYTYY